MRLNFISRIRQIDNLIRIKGTGTPDELASRIGVSRRCLYDYLNTMKEEGAPIKYDHYRCTFYYSEEGSFETIFTFCKSQLARNIKNVASYIPFIVLSQCL